MKNRRSLLEKFVRLMAKNETIGLIELQARFKDVPAETLKTFLRWMEAGRFIEIQGPSKIQTAVVIWKGEYQYSPTQHTWPFHSFNGDAA